MGRGNLLAGVRERERVLVSVMRYGTKGGMGKGRTSLSTVSILVCFWGEVRGLARFAVRWVRTS